MVAALAGVALGAHGAGDALSAAEANDTHDARSAAHFATWRATREATVTPFAQHLAEAGLHAVVPLHELLRSASDWQRCDAEPFAVPPAAQWPAVLQVLRLLRQLRADGALGEFEVVSAYRDESLNRCAGGAPRSAHLRHFAVDLLPRHGTDPAAALCTFWRTQGAAWAMGLSRYPSGRIHVDTAGWRTWGADHRGGSAWCTAP